MITRPEKSNAASFCELQNQVMATERDRVGLARVNDALVIGHSVGSPRKPFVLV